MSEMSEGRRDLLLTSEKVTQPSPERIGARFSPAQDHLLVTVQDSGPGLDPATMDHLFDTFYTTKPQGLGMGLAISRSIIEAHGGRLQATSNQPKGASFQFTLPVEVA